MPSPQRPTDRLHCRTDNQTFEPSVEMRYNHLVTIRFDERTARAALSWGG